MILVGVDGGTSHMESVVIDASGAVLGRGHGGPSNHPRGRGMHPQVGAHLVSAIGEALAAARVTAGDVTAISLNLSGRRRSSWPARYGELARSCSRHCDGQCWQGCRKPSSISIG